MPLLETRNVVVRFGGITAVNDASIEVEQGWIQGLIGPNGAGKTTTFNVITGLQPPTEGQVLLDGEDITTLSVQQRARRGVGRTFQRLEVFGSLTVFENVLVAGEMARTWNDDLPDPRKRADELIELVGVTRFRDQPADSIPTGVARLTELARALTIKPRVLLLDEPSSGLDDAETDDFGDLLRRLANEGTSILMVEHDVDLVMSVCEWIDVLDFGQIIARGTPEEIQNDPIVQQAYLGAEVGEQDDEEVA